MVRGKFVGYARRLTGHEERWLCAACVATALFIGVNAQEASAQTRDQLPPTRVPEVVAGHDGVVPVGQELDVRLQTTLRSDTSRAEDRFQATTLVDLTQEGMVLVPAGSLVQGIVSSSHAAGRVNRTGRLALAFESIIVGGREYRIRATATEVFKSEGLEGEAGRIGAGAGVGGIIGGIIGGFKGALAGILIGAGGTMAATEGHDVELPQGTVVRLRFDAPLDVGMRTR